MNGAETSWRQESKTFNPPCYRTSSTKERFGAIPKVPPTMDAFTTAPLVKGDRTTALPYWSDLVRYEFSGDPKVLFEYVWFNDASGGIIPPGTCTSEMQGCGRINGDFTVWEFLPDVSSKWILPVGTNAQWDFATRMADTKARANLNKALINLPLLYAERKETIGMIKNRVSQLGRLALDVQRRDMSRLRKAVGRLEKRKVARDAAGSHLEVIFGMLPLISEVEGMAEFLARPKLDFIRAKGVFGVEVAERPVNEQHMVKWPYADSIVGPNNQNDIATSYRKGVFKERISVRTALRYKLETQLAADARLLGFEPLGAAFDLIPLSFVVGWFSNLDDYIRGLAPAIGVEFETGSRNRRRMSTGNLTTSVLPATCTPYYGLTRKWTKTPQRIGVIDQTFVKRNDVRTVLVAPPELTLDWDIDVGLYEATAGLSLMIQRYIKPLKRLIKSKPFHYRAPRPKWLKDITYRKV